MRKSMIELKTLRKVARETLPARLFGPLRAVGTALLTPLLFSARTGHARSSLQSRAMNGAGEPTPWITYPAIDLLRSKDLRDKRVLEFGAGQSTLFWAARTAGIVSFEDSRDFYDEVVSRLPRQAEVHLVPASLEGVASRLGTSTFDIILVDGLDRRKACELALRALAPDGVIILDNAEGFWGPDGTYPIMDMFRGAGLQRVDFYGFAPGMLDPHCTSMFFGPSCFLFQGQDNPRRYASA
jgi:hypothetical protein